MRILKEDAGQLTNFEVLDFLRSRGAAKDPTRVLAPLSPSEFKVYDYLEQSPASTQTRENIAEFVSKCKPYNLTKQELIKIINIRPSENVEFYLLVENIDSRFGGGIEDDAERAEEVARRAAEVLELVAQLLSPPTDQTESISDE